MDSSDRFKGISKRKNTSQKWEMFIIHRRWDKIKRVVWCIGRKYKIMCHEYFRIRKNYLEIKQMFLKLCVFWSGMLINCLLIFLISHDQPYEFSLTNHLMTEGLTMSLYLMWSLYSWLYHFSPVILLLCVAHSCFVRPIPFFMRIYLFLYVFFSYLGHTCSPKKDKLMSLLPLLHFILCLLLKDFCKDWSSQIPFCTAHSLGNM